MIRIIFFSDKLIQIRFFVKLQIIKISRLLTILFKRRKKLEKVTFGYHQKWHFDNAYLFVELKFNNAVWFRIEKFKGYDFSKQIVFDLEKIQNDTLNLEVFGFFQKQVYEINLNKEAIINTQSFKIKFENINTFDLLQQKVRARLPKIGLHITNPIFAFKHIDVIQKNIQIDYKPFKIQDYI